LISTLHAGLHIKSIMYRSVHLSTVGWFSCTSLCVK